MAPFFKRIGGEVRGLHQAAYLLGFFALLAQILSLLRDRIFASQFGAGETLDVYYAAFKIPDLLFVCIASLLSVYVLIPFVTERLGDKEELRRFVGSMVTLLGGALALASAVVFVTAPFLVHIFFSGFSPDAAVDMVMLTRILLLQAFFLGVANLFSSVTQSFRRFVLVAASPLLYNIGILLGVLVFYPMFGLPGLAWGAVFGAFLQLLLQIPFLIEERLMPRTVLPRLREVRQVLALSIPRTFSLTANNAALFIYAAFATLLPVGSLTIFTFAYNLQNAPITIIGLSYSVAVFPALAALFAKGATAEFRDTVISAARHIIFWTTPAIVFVIVLRAHIVRIILGSGAFDWTDTRLTAAALALFALSLTAHGLILLLVRAYYAAGNTKTPLIATLISVPVGIGSSFLFLKWFYVSDAFRHIIQILLRVEDIDGTASLMLPLGYSVGIILQAFILSILFTRDFGGFVFGIRRMLTEVILASLAGGYVCYTMLNILDPRFDKNSFIGIFSQGAIAGLVGVGALILLLKILGNNELDETLSSIRTKFWRTKTLVPVEEA